MKKRTHVLLTQKDYDQIKKMATIPAIKNRMIAEMTKRSLVTICSIKRSKSFEDYKKITAPKKKKVITVIKNQKTKPYHFDKVLPSERVCSLLESQNQLLAKIYNEMVELKKKPSSMVKKLFG